MSAWLDFGASVVGGAVAAAAALGGVALGQRGENTRLTKADRQHLRDLKCERLRKLYEPLVKFAMLLQQVAKEKSYVMEGDTVEKRDERHQNELAAGMHQVGTVIAATVIEPGTIKVLKAYEATYAACDSYLRSLNTNATVHNSTTYEDLQKQFAAILSAADSLKATVLKQLEELEQPIQ
jgi:hypothetical protein